LIRVSAARAIRENTVIETILGRTMSDESNLERMSAVDRAWLEMDTPHNPMIMCALLELQGTCDPEALARTLGERLIRFPRFRQCALLDRHPAAWSPDDGLDPHYHMRIRVLEDAGDDCLRKALAHEMSLALDRARPLWRCTLLVRKRGHVSILFRAHHAMGDGMSMMRILTAQGDGAEPIAPEPAAAAHTGPLGRWIDRLATANTWLEAASQVVAEDVRDLDRLKGHVREARKAVAAVSHVLALDGADQPHELRPPLSGHRHYGWSESLSLTKLRGLARRHGVHLNDLFLAALSGGFREWLLWRDVDLQRQADLRVSIPVDLRAADDHRLGNHFGLVVVALPTSLESRMERLQACTERMAHLKSSGEARALLIGLGAAGHLPGSLERQITAHISDKSVAVVSNVPGPEKAVWVDGMKVKSIVFWPPQAAEMGIAASLLSYAGQVTLGVCTDAAVDDEPRQLVGFVEAELEAFAQQARPVAPKRKSVPARRARRSRV
jgi:WS/DGAT/MGAT family acyltransferase